MLIGVEHEKSFISLAPVNTVLMNKKACVGGEEMDRSHEMRQDRTYL